MTIKKVKIKSDKMSKEKQLGTFLTSSLSSILKISKDGASFEDIKTLLLDIQSINSNLWGLMALAGDINKDEHSVIYKKLNLQLDESIARYRDLLEFFIKESRDLHDKH